MSRPNIVFILSDQQRWDTVGCYGQPLDVTPNLDILATDGVRFQNAFTPQPVCGPARSCLQTGRYATATGCWRNSIALPQSEKTIAHWLLERDYHLGYVGKWHLASTGGRSDGRELAPVSHRRSAVPAEWRGGYAHYWMGADALEATSHGYGGHVFDRDCRQVDLPGYRADALTDFALDFLSSDHGDRPFFLFLSYLEPHQQNDRDTYEGPKGVAERFADFPVPGDLAELDGDWKLHYPEYLACCWSVDRNVGRIRAHLDRLGVAKDTVFIYTSDHGNHFRTRNWEYKRSCHDASIRVPLIAAGPGFAPGTLVDELVSLIDVAPTVLSAAGIDTPASMPGRPLQIQAGDGETEPREQVYVQLSESQVGRAIRTHRWKYAVRDFDRDGWTESRGDRYMEDFLYDLEADPYERCNLVYSVDHDGVRTDLATRLKAEATTAGETPFEIVPAVASVREDPQYDYKPGSRRKQ